MMMYKKMSWWYWLFISAFLTSGVLGWSPGFYAVTFLSAVQLIHFYIKEGKPGAFPVQVRIAYLIFMTAALWEPIRFLYWLPLLGTWTHIITGYCFLARLLTLMPWNRNGRLSAALVKRTFLTPPMRGSIHQGLPEESSGERP
jgi:hypothetical protein